MTTLAALGRGLFRGLGEWYSPQRRASNELNELALFS